MLLLLACWYSKISPQNAFLTKEQVRLRIDFQIWHFLTAALIPSTAGITLKCGGHLFNTICQHLVVSRNTLNWNTSKSFSVLMKLQNIKAYPKLFSLEKNRFHFFLLRVFQLSSQDKIIKTHRKAFISQGKRRQDLNKNTCSIFEQDC